MLAEHHDLCVQAETLMEHPIAKMPKATMELAVKELQDVGITLPQALQPAIFKRAVSALQDNLNEGNTKLFMSIVLPWTIGETRTEEVFGGLAQKLAGMGQMPLEAGTTFGDGIISGIVPLEAKGKDEMHNVVKICRKPIAFLDKRADFDAAEAFDHTLAEIVRCLRVLTMIGFAYCMLWPLVVDAFDGHPAKRTKAAKSTLFYRVHFALKSNSAWWELHAEHTSNISRAKDFQDAVEETLFL